ncbi:MAG: HAMP domain-containing histidine kinase [Bacteroidales bacterium]|nr:HAMP domain-containing histidine kinase [Bacteroidales bacterium]
MKLLAYTNKLYLIFSTILLVIAGVVLYFTISGIIHNEINEKLNADVERIAKKIGDGETISSIPPIIEIKQFSELRPETQFRKDTMIFDPVEQEPELFRQVSSIRIINGSAYQITVRQVLIEPHDFYNSIGLVIGFVIILLMAGLFFLHKNISKKAWGPFLINLKNLKGFSLQQQKQLEMIPSKIVEFQELNDVLITLVEKVITDYKNLKTFSEDASHEMQTPLAVIQNNLEEALQVKNIDAGQAKQISRSLQAVKRLQKLIKSLLTFTQIDNRQFIKKQEVSIFKTITTHIDQVQDLIDLKKLKIILNIDKSYRLFTNQHLLDILFSNLVINSIIHNIQNGEVRMDFTNNIFTISNTGLPLEVPPDKLFERFYKPSNSVGTLGLGLAIVKKICDVNDWEINYETSSNRHIIKIHFILQNFSSFKL